MYLFFYKLVFLFAPICLFFLALTFGWNIALTLVEFWFFQRCIHFWIKFLFIYDYCVFQWKLMICHKYLTRALYLNEILVHQRSFHIISDDVTWEWVTNTELRLINHQFNHRQLLDPIDLQESMSRDFGSAWMLCLTLHKRFWLFNGYVYSIPKNYATIHHFQCDSSTNAHCFLSLRLNRQTTCRQEFEWKTSLYRDNYK